MADAGGKEVPCAQLAPRGLKAHHFFIDKIPDPNGTGDHPMAAELETESEALGVVDHHRFPALLLLGLTIVYTQWRVIPSTTGFRNRFLLELQPPKLRKYQSPSRGSRLMLPFRHPECRPADAQASDLSRWSPALQSWDMVTRGIAVGKWRSRNGLGDQCRGD